MGCGPQFFLPQMHLYAILVASNSLNSRRYRRMRRFTSYLVLAFLIGSAVSVLSQSRRAPVLPGQPAETRLPIPETEPTPPSEIPEATDTDERVLRVDTRLVTVPVRVLDRKGGFVVGLNMENFKVFENGQEQEIAMFSNEAQPFTVALLLDMSYSAKFRADEIQNAAIAFIDQLRPDDRVIVVSFDEEVRVHSELTSDRREIYSAIRQTRIDTGTSLYEAVDVTMNQLLKDVEGRKAIVLFTDGVDTTSRRSNDLANLRDAMELDAIIYPIRYDTFAEVQMMKNRAVVIGSNTTRPVGGTPPLNPRGTGGVFNPPVPMIGEPDNKGTTREEYEHGEEYLNQLAFRTGGRVLVADTIFNMNQAFARIAAELRQYYSLGYYPEMSENDRNIRRIRVRVDVPNVAVRARESYVLASQ
jgi:Ca-activated chloride channel homolog